MANKSFSINIGQSEKDITVGTDAPSTGDIELSINLSKLRDSGSNSEIFQALAWIMAYISGGKDTGVN